MSNDDFWDQPLHPVTDPVPVRARIAHRRYHSLIKESIPRIGTNCLCQDRSIGKQHEILHGMLGRIIDGRSELVGEFEKAVYTVTFFTHRRFWSLLREEREKEYARRRRPPDCFLLKKKDIERVLAEIRERIEVCSHVFLTPDAYAAERQEVDNLFNQLANLLTPRRIDWSWVYRAAMLGLTAIAAIAALVAWLWQ